MHFCFFCLIFFPNKRCVFLKMEIIRKTTHRKIQAGRLAYKNKSCIRRDGKWCPGIHNCRADITQAIYKKVNPFKFKLNVTYCGILLHQNKRINFSYHYLIGCRNKSQPILLDRKKKRFCLFAKHVGLKFN